MTQTQLSPFAAAAPDLVAMGFSVLPLIPPGVMTHSGRGKCPGSHVSGGWRGMADWAKFRDTTPSSFQMKLWRDLADANIGLVMGTPAGKLADGTPLFVCAVDIDMTDPDAVEEIKRALPTTGMSKRGAKGLSLFYRAPKTVRSRSFDDERIPRGSGVSRRLVDLLTGFDTRQTVCPPSVHPETMQAYAWLSGPVAAHDLPVLDDAAVEKLAETLEGFGYDPAAARGGRGERKPYVGEAQGESGDAFDDAKRAALANIGAWVHDVDNLHGLRPARNGFEAVSLMRDSSTGQPLHKRKRNLSIQTNGITDFGTGATFSAIDLVALHNDLSVSEALTFLEDRLGLNAATDGIVIDLRPRNETAPSVPAEGADEAETCEVVGGTAATVSEPSSAETHAAEFPAHLLDCPGLVGDLADWMMRTAQRPLPAANLLTALAVVGTAAGRRFAGPTEAGTALYGLALAPTGSGKAHPIRAAQYIMRKAGLGNMVAPSSWMSGSAIVQFLGRQPVCLTQVDEAGEFFAKLGGAKASTHERAISGVLRELFGINWGSYQTPGWAASNTAATCPPVIHAPAYSFLGYSVPEAVWDAMQGSDVTNGLLNRFLLVPTVTAGEEQEDPESVFDVPEALVARLRAIAEVGGPLASATMHTDMATEPMVRLPWDGGKTGDAATLFRELRAYCREHPSGEHLMKRTAEIAIRLATIRAIGRAGASASVTVSDMDWGRNVALFSAERMIHDAAAYMSETEWQQKALHVLRIIREAPGGAMTKSGLYRKLNHKYKTTEVKAIIEGLQEAGQIVGNSTRTGERGPASTTYRAV